MATFNSDTNLIDQATSRHTRVWPENNTLLGDHIEFTGTGSTVTADDMTLFMRPSGAGNSHMFGDSNGGDGNIISLDNVRIHATLFADAVTQNNTYTQNIWNDVEFFLDASDFFQFGKWRASTGDDWQFNNVSLFAPPNGSEARMGLNTVQQGANAVFNNVRFYNGDPDNPEGCSLEATARVNLENATFGPIGRSAFSNNIFARFDHRQAAGNNPTLPLLGLDLRYMSTAAATANLGLTTFGDGGASRTLRVLILNPLIGRPTGTGSLYLRREDFGEAAGPTRFITAIATNPVAASGGNHFHRYILSNSVEAFMALPAQITPTTTIAAVANDIIDNPEHGLMFIEEEYIPSTASQSQVSPITQEQFPTLASKSYRKYSWLQQPDNNTFGREFTVTPPPETTDGSVMSDATVAVARANGYSRITNGALDPRDNVDANDPEDAVVLSSGHSFTDVENNIDVMNGVGHIEDIYLVGKHAAISNSTAGNHMQMPFEVNGTVCQFAGNLSTLNLNATSSASAYNGSTLSIPVDTTLIGATEAGVNDGSLTNLSAGSTDSINWIGVTTIRDLLLSGGSHILDATSWGTVERVTFVNNPTIVINRNIDITDWDFTGNITFIGSGRVTLSPQQNARVTTTSPVTRSVALPNVTGTITNPSRFDIVYMITVNNRNTPLVDPTIVTGANSVTNIDIAQASLVIDDTVEAFTITVTGRGINDFSTEYTYDVANTEIDITITPDLLANQQNVINQLHDNTTYVPAPNHERFYAEIPAGTGLLTAGVLNADILATRGTEFYCRYVNAVGLGRGFQATTNGGVSFFGDGTNTCGIRIVAGPGATDVPIQNAEYRTAVDARDMPFFGNVPGFRAAVVAPLNATVTLANPNPPPTELTRNITISVTPQAETVIDYPRIGEILEGVVEDMETQIDSVYQVSGYIADGANSRIPQRRPFADESDWWNN